MTTKKAYKGSEAAGILAFAEDTCRFLVGKRSDKVNLPGTWAILGGKRDPEDETMEVTAKREFAEETGYDGPMDLLFLMKFADPKVFEYYTFLGIVPRGTIKLQLNYENDQFAWVTYDELKSLDPKHPGLEMLLDIAGDALEEFAARARPEE